MRKLTAEPQWLRALTSGEIAGVDRENKVIRGYIVAQKGPFKTPGRGEFDDKSLDKIVELMNARLPLGVKSRFTHPSESDDGLGKFLGRARNARRDGDSVRADLHLSPVAFRSPSGNLGDYVMDLAESDPKAFGSSLVLQADRELRTEKDGTPAKGEDGEPLPPIWRPKAIHASDVVDDGDAVHDGFLSSSEGVDFEALPDAVQRQGWAILDRVFAGAAREVVEARVLEYLLRYLNNRYRPQSPVSVEILRRRLRQKELEFWR